MPALLNRWIAIYGTALILGWFSEFYFINEGPVDHLLGQARAGWFAAVVPGFEIGVFYMLGAAAFLMSLSVFRVSSAAGFFLAAGLYGLVTEAVLVPAVYESLPFSLIWTSLSWHIYVDAALGWLGLRLALRAERAWVPALYCLALGLFWGLMATWYWGGDDPGGLPPMTFGEFATLTLASAPTLIIGVVLVEVTAGRPFRPHWIELSIVSVICFGLLIATGLPYGAGLVLVALLVGLMFLGLFAERARPARAWAPLRRLETTPRPARYLHLLLVPIGALISYDAVLTLELRMPTLLLVWAFICLGVSGLIAAGWIQARVKRQAGGVQE